MWHLDEGDEMSKETAGAENESWLWNLLDGSIDSQREQPEPESLQGGLSKFLENIAKTNLPCSLCMDDTTQQVSPCPCCLHKQREDYVERRNPH